ncbi:MAG: hypothetical protein OXH79_14970 [Boseongicola sp.]|nr:hypothetical protein [Boseongicola sp.]
MTELLERATAFMDANPVFRRDEFAAAMGLPKDSAAVGRLLWKQVAAERIRRLRREVFAAVPDHRTPGRLVLPDYIHVSEYRPDGVLGYHTGLMLFGIQHSVFISEVQVISSGTSRFSLKECREGIRTAPSRHHWSWRRRGPRLQRRALGTKTGPPSLDPLWSSEPSPKRPKFALSAKCSRPKRLHRTKVS